MAVAQNNSGRLISVEPDHVVWAVGEFNKVSVQATMANNHKDKSSVVFITIF